MKMRVLVAGIFLAAAPLVRAAVDLTAFDGKFKGPLSVTTPSDSYTGTSKIVIDVSRSGSTARLEFSGGVNNGPVVVPWGGVLNLKKKGKANTTQVVMVELSLPGTGKFRPKGKSRISATVAGSSFGNQYVQTDSLKVRAKGRKKKLTGTIAVTRDGAPVITYTINAVGR